MASLSGSNHVARVLSVANHVTEQVTDRVADVDAGSRIAASWRRCLINHKLDPARQGPPQTLTAAEGPARCRAARGVIRLAAPELDDLARVAARGRLLRQSRRPAAPPCCSAACRGEADAKMFTDWKIYTGSNFAEDSEGTNGLGTALAEERPILGASRRAFSRAVAHVLLRRGAAVRPVRPHRRRGQHHLLPRGPRAVRASAGARGDDGGDAPDRGALFRNHFRKAWIATVPGDGGAALLAYDDDRRIVGACRAARDAGT